MRLGGKCVARIRRVRRIVDRSNGLGPYRLPEICPDSPHRLPEICPDAREMRGFEFTAGVLPSFSRCSFDSCDTRDVALATQPRTSRLNLNLISSCVVIFSDVYHVCTRHRRLRRTHRGSGRSSGMAQRYNIWSRSSRHFLRVRATCHICSATSEFESECPRSVLNDDYRYES